MNDNQNAGDVMQEAAAPLATDTQDAQAGPQTSDQMVPLSALQSERAQRQHREIELEVIRDHVALLQANQAQAQTPRKDEFEGMSENDVLTVGEAKKFMSQFNRQFQLSVEELRMTQKYPDYQEVVTKYLPEVLKENPRIRDSLQTSQDYELAYYLARNCDAYKAENKKRKINSDAERIVQNSQKAGSISSVGSTSPISQAKRYKSMSDDDFMREVNKNLGYA